VPFPYVPAEHVTHVVAPGSCEKEPAPHTWQTDDWLPPIPVLSEPAGQDVHTVVPSTGAYEPPGHSRHNPAPDWEANDPVAHQSQADDPINSTDDPGTHAVQADGGVLGGQYPGR